MTKYRLDTYSATEGVIINTVTNEYVALVSTKRPDLLFDGLRGMLRVANKNSQPQLNDNQEIVLEWLKENAMVWELENIFSEAGGEILNAYDALTYREQFEVLQAFAEWGVKETTK